MNVKGFVIGIDFGTDSVRSLLVNATNGDEIATSVVYFPRWKEGKYCNPASNQFRHHPLDYLESMESSLRETLAMVSNDVKELIMGISIDTTGSTPAPMNAEGKILAELSEFAENPNGMFILWKDHTSVLETDDINRTAKIWGGEDFTKYEGGVYSSEWYWSKILHTIRTDPAVRESAISWIELCDWVPAVLTGVSNYKDIIRSRCAAGHKAMWHESWHGLPAEEFLLTVDPLLGGLRDRLYVETETSEKKAGTLSNSWAKKLGLSEKIIVGVGAFDAHMGAIGAGIESYSMVKIIGTSTCDIMLAPKSDIGNTVVKGICGQVDGSVFPDMIGLEAGQSGFGDVYAWFKKVLAWPIRNLVSDPKVVEEMEAKIIPHLTKQAAILPIDESGLIALDWLNGRRTPDANQHMKGAITGLNLGTDAPKLFRALVEATAYGARAINDCIESQGVPIREIIAIGGVSKKSDFVMQVLADVLNRKIKISRSDQTCALGAAMCAAVAAGIYPTLDTAQKAMNSGYVKKYIPNPESNKKYEKIYKKYLQLGDLTERLILDKGV